MLVIDDLKEHEPPGDEGEREEHEHGRTDRAPREQALLLPVILDAQA
jgi:hypothetical protein